MLAMERKVAEIEHLMGPIMNGMQAKHLHAVLSSCLLGVHQGGEDLILDNSVLIEMFLSAKRLEGCSERSMIYYSSTLSRFIESIGKPLVGIRTEDIRKYLSDYQAQTHASNVTIDNIRRIISSFFTWLEIEDHIYKSPVKRIKKIKSVKPVKPVYSDEVLETLRDNCVTSRDLAIIDLLASAGIRVGELVQLDKADVDLEARECIVHGKGSKERKYTLMHAPRYICKLI